MQLLALLTTTIGIAIQLCAGRVLLACLPPGAPGGRDFHTLPVTLATSFLLASAVSIAIAGPGQASNALTFMIVGAAILLLALLRIAASPAAMVPRHEPPLAAHPWIARAGTILACVLIVLPRGEGDWHFGEMVLGVPLLFLVMHALEVARVPSWARAASALLFALIVYLVPLTDERPLAFGPIFFGAGAAFTVPWLRRADRRSLMLSLLFYSAAALWFHGDWALSVAGLTWLVIGTPRPSRARVFGLALACAAIVVAIEFLNWDSSEAHRHAFTSAEITTPIIALVALVLLIVGFARWHDARHARDGAWNPSGARVGHEESILLRTIVTALVLHLAAQRFAPDLPVGDAVQPALLVLTLLAGLALKRFTRASVVQAPA